MDSMTASVQDDDHVAPSRDRSGCLVQAYRETRLTRLAHSHRHRSAMFVFRNGSTQIAGSAKEPAYAASCNERDTTAQLDQQKTATCVHAEAAAQLYIRQASV